MKRFLTAAALTVAFLAAAPRANAGGGSMGYSSTMSWSYWCNKGGSVPGGGFGGFGGYGGTYTPPVYFHIQIVPGSDYFPMIPQTGGQGGY